MGQESSGNEDRRQSGGITIDPRWIVPAAVGCLAILGLLAVGIANLPWETKEMARLEHDAVYEQMKQDRDAFAAQISQIQTHNTQADLNQTSLTASVNQLAATVSAIQANTLDNRRDIDDLRSHDASEPSPGRRR